MLFYNHIFTNKICINTIITTFITVIHKNDSNKFILKHK